MSLEGSLLKDRPLDKRAKIEQQWKKTFDFDNDDFRDQTGIDVLQLKDYRAKMTFLLFWKSSTENRERLINFANAYGEDGIAAIATITNNENGGENVLEIGEKANHEDARKVFSKVSELSTLVENFSKEFGNVDAFFDSAKMTRNEEFAKLKYLQGIMLQTIEKLTQRINNIVVSFHDIVAGENASEKQVSNFIGELDTVKAMVAALKEMLISAKENGTEIDFDIIKDLKFSCREPKNIEEAQQALSEDEKNQILSIYEENWRKTNPAIADEMIKHFKKTLENLAGLKFYVLKHKEEVIAFCRVEPREDGKAYIGSLNVYKDLQQVNVGKKVLDDIVSEESQKNILLAETSLRNGANSCYVEQYGFVFDGIILDSFNTGEPFFTGAIDIKQNETYKFKNKSSFSEEALLDIKNKTQEFDTQLAEKENFVLKFENLEKDFQRYLPVFKQLLLVKDDSGNIIPKQNLENKYKITRYIRDKEQNIYYLAFEKTSTRL